MIKVPRDTPKHKLSMTDHAAKNKTGRAHSFDMFDFLGPFLASKPRIEESPVKAQQLSELLGEYAAIAWMLAERLSKSQWQAFIKRLRTTDRDYNGYDPADEVEELVESLLKQLKLKTNWTTIQFSLTDLYRVQELLRKYEQDRQEEHNTQVSAILDSAKTDREKVAEARTLITDLQSQLGKERERTKGLRRGSDLEWRRRVKYYLIAVMKQETEKSLSTVVFTLCHNVFENENARTLRKAFDKWRKNKGYDFVDIINDFENKTRVHCQKPFTLPKAREFCKDLLEKPLS